MKVSNPPCALTVAGFDSSAGAGICADLKTFTALGVYGTCVITSVTAQNTQGIQKIFHLPEELVASQIQSVCQDIKIDAVKIGMLGGGRIVSVVVSQMLQLRPPNLVVDPILRAKDGSALLDDEGIIRLRQDLLPLAKVVTPNLSEAAAITGNPVESPSEMREAARAIHALGAEWVLLKGGHLKDRALDILFDGREFVEFESPRVAAEFEAGGGVHGTGCTLSSAIAAELAKGKEVAAAVKEAKRFVTRAIEQALIIGQGYPVANQFYGFK